MKNYAGSASVIVLVAMVIAILAMNSRSPTPAAVAPPAEALASGDEYNRAIDSAVTAAAQPSPTTAWNYTTNADDMTDKPTRLRCVTSTNQVSLDFPYKDVSADLCLRDHPRFGHDAFLQLNGEGQILCRTYDGCTIKVRFDDGPVESFSATPAADYSSDVIFIVNRKRLEAELRNAKQTRVQVEFFRNGSQTLSFPTDGLKDSEG